MRYTDILGRIYTVHPKNYVYLRLLLVKIREATTFESLRIVNGIVCPTFCAVCQELNFLKTIIIETRQWLKQLSLQIS